MKGKRVVVTGGFGALGHIVASQFADLGAVVCRVDYAAEPRKKIPSVVDIGGVDLTDYAQSAQVVEKVVGDIGGIDILVNIAGGFTWEPVSETSLDLWKRLHEMNLLTAVSMSKASLDEIKKSTVGRIINLGAFAALESGAGFGPYSSSKSGVHRLTESLAKELRDTNVTVNAILPSIIDTEANRQAMPDSDFSEWVSPSAISDVIQFLASDASRGISGALIPVTRGS